MHKTFLYLKHFLSLRHVKMTALENECFVFLKMAFWVRKVSGAFEKRAPGK